MSTGNNNNVVPPPPPDAADEAGGEAIFSSDGLPSLPIPKAPPPPVQQQQQQKQQDNDVLDTETHVDPTQAFEVFSGKLYYPPPTTTTTNRSSSLLTSQETPLQRLARLQQEVSEVEQDLQHTEARSSGADDEAAQANLAKLASELASRLKVATSSSSSYSQQQEALTALVQQHVQNQQKTKTQTKSETADDRVVDASSGVVYELYGGAASATNEPTTSRLEERLLRIQQAVGSSNNTSSSSTENNKSLFQRLEELEEEVKRVNPKTLEEAATRAKVIRADLEAASKARAKLASAASGGGASFSSHQDAKTIAALHDQMIQLQGISAHLPALVQRLQQLAKLHQQVGTFSTRLTAAENMIQTSYQTLTSIEESVSKLEESMTTNLHVVEQNMMQLDERMKKM